MLLFNIFIKEKALLKNVIQSATKCHDGRFDALHIGLSKDWSINL